jgi:uncharacterized protein YuzE
MRLLIQFRDAPVAESRDLDEDTVLDLDAKGSVCAITIEHASQRADAPQFSFETVAATTQSRRDGANWA